VAHIFSCPLLQASRVSWMELQGNSTMYRVVSRGTRCPVAHAFLVPASEEVMTAQEFRGLLFKEHEREAPGCPC